jgi:hypothetical protein
MGFGLCWQGPPGKGDGEGRRVGAALQAIVQALSTLLNSFLTPHTTEFLASRPLLRSTPHLSILHALYLSQTSSNNSAV